MPTLPAGLSIIDLVIAFFFALQIVWGARLGFVLATFSLAGEILGLIAAVLYTPTVAGIANAQWKLTEQISGNISKQTKIPEELTTQLATTLFEAIVFVIVFVVTSTIFFFIGKFIHHQIGVRRITHLSNSFFGMFVGGLKAVLEILFALASWDLLTRDPGLQTALQAFASSINFSPNSYLLPIFQKLIPTVLPFANFF